ncbi:MAG: N-acetyl-gamma-glutamyl-phosphate reductase [Acidobacteria bacterium]|nr:MAG: N-acetyl-gamma-glutamyl-phosphate reductase [Acidobacteriota bacterium]
MMNNYSIARVGIAGATGYAGRELLRLLSRHPHAGVAAALDSTAGVEAMAAVTPDLVFLATPAEVSRAWVTALRLFTNPPRIVDLSPAFRFESEAAYGWPERNAAAIRKAMLVANPGCYATATNLVLGPLLAAGAIEPTDIICDAKSGASGAGRALRQDLQFCELDGNCKPYNIYSHRHAPEIARHAGLDGETFAFTPHLLPVPRGILATHYVRCRTTDLGAVYAEAYAGKPFIRVRGGDIPELHDVLFTNYCDIGWKLRADGKQAVIVGCLDNLVKGAAGQAIQNANLMMGWPEGAGLV